MTREIYQEPAKKEDQPKGIKVINIKTGKEEYILPDSNDYKKLQKNIVRAIAQACDMFGPEYPDLN